MAIGDVITKEMKRKLDSLLQKANFIKNNSAALKGIVAGYDENIHEVFDKIKAVEGISNRTNLLAINASIETIHASDLIASFENIVKNNLLIQARVIAKILEYDPDFLYQDATKLAKDCGIEELFITDTEGVVKFTNLPSWMNGTLGSAQMLRILKNPELEVALPSVGSGVQNELFKSVGISRRDSAGIIQLGAHYVKPAGQLAIDGFGIVAQEAKRLADASKEISARITLLTKDMGQHIEDLLRLAGEAENHMNEMVALMEKALEDKTIDEGEEAEMEAYFALTQRKLVSVEEMLKEISKSFRNLLSPLTELINIARQTNLLGVRAAIEAAHSTNDKLDFDQLLDRHMVTEAKLAAILVERTPDITVAGIKELAAYSGIGEFWITDESGNVELTNVEGGVGFAFTNEGQTAPYMRILADPGLVVTAPPAARTLDNKVFKFVAVGRKGKPGIFQIGNPSRLYGDTAEGFSVVSKQIKDLAEQSKGITQEIDDLIRDMDGKAHKGMEVIKVINKHLSLR